jgi:hypothetical protein
LLGSSAGGSLAAGCVFVVAVTYASVSPQAGTNRHPAAISP